MVWIFIILFIVALTFITLFRQGKKKVKDAENIVRQIYEVVKFDKSKQDSEVRLDYDRERLINAGILYGLVDIFFFEIANINILIRTRYYISLLRSYTFSENELSCVKEFLFNCGYKQGKLKGKPKTYFEFIKSVADSSSFLIKGLRSGNPLLDSLENSEWKKNEIDKKTNELINLFLAEVRVKAGDYLQNKNFPKVFLDITS